MAGLRELRVFVAVAERLSFTRAAEELGLTQQTVSKTIRDLETELDVELLERTSHAVRLTAAGQALLGPGRDTLAQAEAAFTAARAVGTGRSGTVQVGVTPAVGPETRMEVARSLRSAGELSIALRDLRPGELRAALRDRVVDIALASVTGTVDASLGRTALRPARMRIHVRAEHPLARAGTVALGNFDGERLLTASPAGTPYTDALLERFAAESADVTPVVGRVTGGAQRLIELLDAAAVAAMPCGTASPAGIIALEAPGFTMPLNVLWAAGREPHAVALLREWLGP